MHVIDITDAESAAVVAGFNMHKSGSDIQVQNGYAYISTYSDDLIILDVDPIESINIVHTVVLNDPKGVFLSGNIAYVADKVDGLVMIDITTPESAFIIQTPNSTSPCEAVWVEGGIAFLTSRADKKLYSYLVNPPTDVVYQGEMLLPGYPSSIIVDNWIAFITENNNTFGKGKLHAVDVYNYNSPHILSTVETVAWALSATISHDGMDLCYVADKLGGLYSVEISDPYYIDDYVWDHRPTLGGARASIISGDYAIVADGFAGIRIIDINPPWQPQIIDTIPTDSQAMDIDKAGNYALVTDKNGAMIVLDISDPGNAGIHDEIAVSDVNESLTIDGDYAYVACGGDGVYILDISDIAGGVFVTKIVDTPGWAKKISTQAGCIFVADKNSGLTVIDTDPVESAYVVDTIDLGTASRGVETFAGYTYVATGSDGILIFDSDPFESTYQIGAISSPDFVHELHYDGSYLFASIETNKLAVLDTSVPGSPFYLDSILVPGFPRGFTTVGDYVCVAAGDGGFRTFLLN